MSQAHRCPSCDRLCRCNGYWVEDICTHDCEDYGLDDDDDDDDGDIDDEDEEDWE